MSKKKIKKKTKPTTKKNPCKHKKHTTLCTIKTCQHCCDKLVETCIKSGLSPALIRTYDFGYRIGLGIAREEILNYIEDINKKDGIRITTKAIRKRKRTK